MRDGEEGFRQSQVQRFQLFVNPLSGWGRYNGLQIFEVGKVDYTVDASLFPELPPSQCKKGTKDQAKAAAEAEEDPEIPTRDRPKEKDLESQNEESTKNQAEEPQE